MRNFLSRIPRVVTVVVSGVVALGVIALVVVTALGGFAGSGSGPIVRSGNGAPASSTKQEGSASVSRAERSKAKTQYYVSLGDSYSVGYQPSPTPGATAGYTGYVARKAHLRLANFGCGGATTASILTVDGCTQPYGPAAKANAVAYANKTQAAAAVAFLRAHRGHIALITVSISGNDITHCATVSNPTGCVLTAVPEIEKNVTTLARELRAAAGKHVPLIGLTYPDVLLGLWVYPPGQADTSLASLSVTAFKSLLNPALTKAYGAAGGVLVDVTKLAGGYVALSKTTTLAPYGTIPVAVANTCELTWYCTQGNIHAKSAGYELIGKAVVSRYDRLKR
ncbi:MAG: SGNH/GDSL hydrolase family protein [Acidimicrobiales bacterium]